MCFKFIDAPLEKCVFIGSEINEFIVVFSFFMSLGALIFIKGQSIGNWEKVLVMVFIALSLMDLYVAVGIFA